MPGTFHTYSKQKGTGHGARNHRHASGNKLVAYYYACFHAGWKPDRSEEPRLSKQARGALRHKKNKANRRK